MKRIISHFVLVIMLFTQMAYATTAFEIFDVTISYNSLSDSLSIEGFVETHKVNLPIAVKIEKDGNVVNAAELVADKLSNGYLSFSFDDIKFSDSATDGVYDVYISSKYSPQEHYTFNYKGADELFDIMKSIQQYTNSEDFSSLMGVVHQKYDLLGVDYSLYGGLNNDTEKNLFKSVLLSKTYALKSDAEYTSATEKKIDLRKDVNNFAAYYNEAYALVEFTRINTVDSMRAWDSKYSLNFDLDTDEVLFDYFNEVKSTALFIEHLNKNNKISTKEDVVKRLYENTLLTLIETKHFSTLQSLFTQDYYSYIPYNQSNYNSLAPDKKSLAFSDFSEVFYETTLDATTALDGYISGYMTGPSQGGVNDVISPEWGTASPSTSPSIGFTDSGSKNNMSPATGLFADVNKGHWAEAAISTLYDKGIVSGYNGNFEPNANVTRAQFIKMIILARNVAIPTSVNTSFVDVSSDSWYSPYVAAAEQAGIIMGDTESRFNPESLITRQDMAVVIYRAFDMSNAQGGKSFADTASISSYAVDAVSAMSAQKILNGYENGCFYPHNNAIRAEAAQVIYNVLMR